MFEEFFDGASRVQALRDSPGGPLLEGFAKELFQVRYAQITARRHIRAGDIVQLRLSDINWRYAEICVSGKGRREVRPPLTQEVGCALVAYLQDGRPRTGTDALFAAAPTVSGIR
jgi:site-specific recombinase XerC